MRKILLFLFGLILTSSVIGQTVAGYSFSQPAGTWAPISGGTVLGTGTIDDNSYNANPIGFTFTFRGVAQTQFSVNANGFLAMGASITSSYSTLSSGSSNDVVAACNRDLQGQLTGELRYETTGSAPNRTLVVQWLHFGKYGYSGTGAGDDWSFQIRLNETTNTVDIVYGSFTVNATSTTVQVGLSGATRADFNDRATTTNWAATTAGGANSATCTLSNTVLPASGLTFRFTPPPPCTTPLGQPTALVLVPGITAVLGSFTPSGSADSYLVVRSTASTLSATPVDGTTYTAGAAFGGGNIQYFGTASNFTSTGLTAGTQYYYFVFAANNATCSGGPLYLTSPAALTNNTTTLASPASICGTKTVGTSGADYLNLTTAMFALSNSTMTCAVTILVNADYNSATEAWPIIVPVVLGSSATNTLTIKPNAGALPSILGTVATGTVFRILNSNTILDGSNTVGGTTQDMIITNQSATNPSCLLIGSTGTTPVTNVTVKNLMISNSTNAGSPSKGIYICDGATQGNQGYFNNITVQNNLITRSQDGVYARAFPVAGNGNGLLITGNTLNNAGTASIRRIGLYVEGVDGGTVSNNNVGNIANAVLGDASITGIWLASGTKNTNVTGNTISGISTIGNFTSPRGIAISPVAANANINITGNTISNITSDQQSYTVGIFFFSAAGNVSIQNNSISNIKNTSNGGWGSVGLLLQSSLTTANVSVINNIIWDVAAYGYTGYTYTDNGYGIDVSSGAGYKIYFNTVYMNTNQTSPGYPAAINIESGITLAGAVDLRNNIFSTTATTGTPYAILSSAPNTVFSPIDYNDYFCAGTNLGYIGATNRVTLADIVAGFGGNANSQNINPTFVGTDLHPTNAALANKGLYMALVPTDITGALRSDPTDMGAYQFGAAPVVATTAATNLTTISATINGSVTASNHNVGASFEWGLTSGYGSTATATPSLVTGNTATTITADLTGLTVNNTYHYRAKGVSGSTVLYGADMTFSTAVPPAITTIAAAPVGATFATLNGSVNPKNDNTVVSFEYGLTTSYGLTAPVGSYTGNTTQTFYASITGLTINLTYHFRAKAVNAVGTFYGADMTFFTTCVVPPVPGAITGPALVCKNVTGYTYSVATVPYGFLYNWTFPAGFTISSYPHSNVVTVDVAPTAVSGTVTVTAVSDCGAPSPPSSTGVTVNNLPVPTVTGPVSVCPYTSYNYTTQTGMSNYIWTVTPNGTITPTANPNVVSISWTSAGAKTVGVIYTNPATTCTAASPGTASVTVLAPPTPTISGANSLCANTGYFDYTTQPGMTAYVWTVSSGGTITAGQGTAVAQIVWNTPGAQFVTVNYNNAGGCSALTPTTFSVTVNGIPGAAGTISGTSNVCSGSSGIAYSVPAIANAASYVWSLPAGASIASGNWTNSITVNFAANAVSGAITVYGNSLCGNGATSAPFNVTVTQLPVAAGTITGAGTVCTGQSGVPYSVAPIAGATGYAWTLPSGASIATGANSPNITVDFARGASSGFISVHGTNFCGEGVESSAFAVTVNQSPDAPMITASGDTLASNTAFGNQWYYEGAPILTGTGPTLIAHYTGWYWDKVTVNGCSSDTSNHIYIIVTGIGEPLGSSFVVYPVPNDGQFKLSMNTPTAQTFNVSISNNLGVYIYKKVNVIVNGQTDLVIDLRPISAGIYTMIIRNSDNKIIRKIVVNR